MGLEAYVLVSVALFAMGLICIVSRRNILYVLMGIAIILNSSSINFSAFSHFNGGGLDLLRDVKLGPVFFGETLISADVPNLTYMLSADDVDAHKEHWKAFLAHPEWKRMKAIEKYQGTVSKITSVMLAPTEYSKI